MSSENWYFTADTNAKGYTYIKAYQTEWDPVRKRSRSINRRHVGRLHEDGHVTPSPGFLASFPQYAGYTLYYGANKQLVDEMTYRRDFPDSPGPKRDAEDLMLGAVKKETFRSGESETRTSKLKRIRTC